MSLTWISKKQVNFCRAEISRINFDQNFSTFDVGSDLINTLARPRNLPANTDKCELHKLADGVGLTSGQHIIIRHVLLQNAPHTFNIIASMPPISLGIYVTEKERFLKSKHYSGDSARNLARYKCLTARRPLMIKENAV